jgi:glycosyltransferase involved in cell wall biosynthesis
VNRIAFLIPTIDRIGGAEQQVLQLATGLAHRGWESSVIALSGNGGAAARSLQSSGVAFHSLRMRRGLADPRGWLRLHAWIATNHPDVLHAHLPHASLLSRWSRIVSPVRVALDTIHTPATGDPTQQLSYRLSSSLPDLVTAVSHAAAHPWLEAGLVSDRNLAILPNGIDTDSWRRDETARRAMRHDLELSDDKFLWLAVGRLDSVKNHSTLLRAFARIPNQCRLVIAGAGPLQAELHSLASALGLRDRVSFPGFQTDVHRWMQAADGLVHCSSWEGLPIVLLEAGACELPSVITDIPGSREVLPNQFPPPVPVGDPSALAAAMSAIVSLPREQRRELGRRARISICARFDLNAVLTQWEALYGALLERNPHPSRFGTSAPALGRTLQLQ